MTNSEDVGAMKQKTRYRVREIYDRKYDTSFRVWADIPTNVPIMLVVSRTKNGNRMGFKRLAPQLKGKANQ